MAGSKFFNIEKSNDNNKFITQVPQNETFVASSMVSPNYNQPQNNVTGYDPMRQMPQNSNNMMPNQGNLIQQPFMNQMPQNNSMKPVQAPQPQPMQQPVQQPIQQPVQQPVAPATIKPNFGNPAPQQPVKQPVQQPVQQPVKNDAQVAINASKEKVEEAKANTGPNPLDNGKNPIPVNPVADGPKDEDLEKLDRYMVSPGECLSVIKNMLFKPGTTIIECANKFRSLKSGLLFTLYFMIISAIICLIGGAISSIFVKTYNNVLETFSISIDFNGITTHNYLDDLFAIIFLNYIPIVLLSIIFYLVSFLNSKGLSLGSYLSIVNIAFIPFLVVYNLFFKLACVMSDTIGIILLVGSILYTIMLTIIGIGDNLKFDSINIKIWYFLISLTVCFALMFILAIYVFFDGISPIAF